MGHLDPFAPTKMTLGGLRSEGPENGHLNNGPQNPHLLVLILSGLIDVFFILQGGFFYWVSSEFLPLKCWPVSNRFPKKVRVLDWPPLMIEKSLSA